MSVNEIHKMVLQELKQSSQYTIITELCLKNKNTVTPYIKTSLQQIKSHTSKTERSEKGDTGVTCLENIV